MVRKFGILIRSEIDYSDAQAAWTDEQRHIWQYLLKDMPDGVIMDSFEPPMPTKKYYKLKAQIRNKVDRILKERGNKTGINTE